MQKVIVNKTFSDPLPVFTEVPQGGIIGPLLFIIHINDITSEIVIHSNINLFADDTKIFS